MMKHFALFFTTCYAAAAAVVVGAQWWLFMQAVGAGPHDLTPKYSNLKIPCS